MADERFDYVGQCPTCGAYCAAVVDDPKYAKDTARSVSKMIQQGLTVTRVDADFVRANFGACTCHKKQANGQMSLFEE